MTRSAFSKFLVLLLLLSWACNSKQDTSSPEVWLSSTKLPAILVDQKDGTPFNEQWQFVSNNIDGIKFWDGQISSYSVEEIKEWIGHCKELNIKIAYEKGRWPLPPDMYQLQIHNVAQRLSRNNEKRSADSLQLLVEAEEHIINDQGEMLQNDLYMNIEEFATKAAQPEIQRLLKIKEAGGLDILEYIEFDGAALKNMYPYTFGKTQWQLFDIPEEDRFKRGFKSFDAFFSAYELMISKIKEAVPEASHVKMVHLPNIHLWTFREDVQPEKQDDGSIVYHNVDFKRFQEHAEDLQDLLNAMENHKDIFQGITTDYPYNFYIRENGNRRYRGFAEEAKRMGFKFGACINSMSGEESMERLNNDSFEFVKRLKSEVQPDMYMVQSWFKHPTNTEIFISEDSLGSFLNLAKRTIKEVKGI